MSTAEHATIAAMIASFAKEIEPQVRAIESSPATTQHHYGDYLSLLQASTQKGGKAQAKFLMLALLKAGGNLKGITAAARINGLVD